MRVRPLPPDHTPWPPATFPHGTTPTVERLRTRLLARIDDNGALREPCRSRVLETALLLRLMDRANITSPERDRLTAYLEARRNSETPLDRALAQAALAGTAAIPADLITQLVSATPEFTRSRKRLMFDGLLTVFGAPLLDEYSRYAEAFSTIGLHPWAEVHVTAFKVILAQATAQPHLIRAGDLELLLSTQHAPQVWEYNVLIHLWTLHALLPLPGTADLIRTGIAKALKHQRDDGGMPFVSDIDIWCTAIGGTALSAVGVPPSALTPLADYLLSQQHADGGWSYTDHSLLTDVDDTAVALEFLRTLNQPEHADAIEQGTTYLLSMRTPSGGFSTYVRGAPPEACVTAAAVNALSTREADASPHDQPLAQALEFLARSQREDGMFGPDWSLSRLHTAFRTTLAARALGPTPPASVHRMRTRIVDAVLTTQNSDGGWGHAPGRPSDAISTSYALIALCHQPDPAPLVRGVSFLLSRRQPDGSIASVPDMVGPRPFAVTFPVLNDIYTLLALGHVTHRTAAPNPLEGAHPACRTLTRPN